MVRLIIWPGWGEASWKLMDENVTGEKMFGDRSLDQINGKRSVLLKCKNGKWSILKSQVRPWSPFITFKTADLAEVKFTFLHDLLGAEEKDGIKINQESTDFHRVEFNHEFDRVDRATANSFGVFSRRIFDFPYKFIFLHGWSFLIGGQSCFSHFAYLKNNNAKDQSQWGLSNMVIEEV